MVSLNADDAWAEGAGATLAGSLGQPRILPGIIERSFDWRLLSGQFDGGRRKWKRGLVQAPFS